MDILLPNNQIVTGTVPPSRWPPRTAKALTEVRVDSKELADASLDNLTKNGTPVIATLQLRDDGPLAGVNDQVFDFLRQIGLK